MVDNINAPKTPENKNHIKVVDVELGKELFIYRKQQQKNKKKLKDNHAVKG